MLITGAASGIGHAIASAFYQQGAVVWSADIGEPKSKIQGVNYCQVDLENLE